MLTQRFASAIIGFALLVATPMAADSVSAPMTVSVQVIARAIVSIDSAPSTIDVTDADIARGYVDVDAPLVVRVKTNSRRGYLLQVDKMSEDFSSIELSLPNASMNVSTHETWIERPFVSGGDTMAIRARLRLAPGASAGSHALPVAFSATPL